MATRKSELNLSRALQLDNAMFDQQSRHLVLVLTLGYCPEHRPYVTPEILQKHRSQLLNNRRCNKLLQGINAYVWKLEEGTGPGGLHLHVLIYYSRENRADIKITRLIGEYWVNVVTQGVGTYWNSNADKDRHARFGHGIGTGQINRNDEAKREALRENLKYLAKASQCIANKPNPHYRTFGTSQFPR